MVRHLYQPPHEGPAFIGYPLHQRLRHKDPIQYENTPNILNPTTTVTQNTEILNPAVNTDTSRSRTVNRGEGRHNIGINGTVPGYSRDVTTNDAVSTSSTDRLTVNQGHAIHHHADSAEQLSVNREHAIRHHAESVDRLTVNHGNVIHYHTDSTDRLAVNQGHAIRHHAENVDRLTVNQGNVIHYHTDSTDRPTVSQGNVIRHHADSTGRLAVNREDVNQLSAIRVDINQTDTRNAVHSDFSPRNLSHERVEGTPVARHEPAQYEAVNVRYSSSHSSSDHSRAQNNTTNNENKKQELSEGLSKKQRKRQRQKLKKQQQQAQQQHSEADRSHQCEASSKNRLPITPTSHQEAETRAIQILKKSNAEMIEENERLSLNCRVCMDETIGVMLLPCAHSAVCTSCSQKLIQCPICRSDIQNSMHIFVW